MNGASKRIKITDLNPNLICVLCGGYFIDATTLTECLHSFCKKCIVKYLETSKQCPVCDVLVHKTRPHLHIRSDKTLQDLVYKLVPGLYKNEMKRRRDFYSKHPDVAPKKVGEERGDEMAERIIYTEDEHFSVALHFSKRGVRDERSMRSLTLPEVVAASKEPPKNVRYLRCPAGVTIGILKKFVRLKYELPNRYEIDIFHTDEALHDDYTLMDIAYVYTWRRRDPLRLNYSVVESRAKRPRHSVEPLGNAFCSKPVKTEDMALLKEETRSVSTKQEASKPNSKQVSGQEKKPTIKAEVVSKESSKPGPKSVEQVELCALQSDQNRRQVSGGPEPAAAPRPEVKMAVDQSPAAQPQAVADTTSTAATTPKTVGHPTGQPLASAGEKSMGRPAMSCAVKIKILQSSSPSSPSSSTAAKAKSATAAARPVSAKVGLTSQLAAGGKSPLENVGAKTSSASGAVAVSKNVLAAAKASDAMAAVGAAHTPEVRKTPQQQGLPPAAAPAPSMTSSLASSSSSSPSVPATSTTGRSAGAPQTPSRQTNVVSSTSTTTAAAVSTTGSSTSEQAPAQTAAAALVLSVSAGDAPAAADAGAAAACASSPAPAALAASSSPSPPMASTAASLKEPDDLHSCSAPPATPASTSSAQSSVQTSLRASLPVVKTTATAAPKNGRSAGAKAADTKNALSAPKSVASEVASSSATAVSKGAGGGFAKATPMAGAKTFGRKGEEASTVAAVSSSDDGAVDKDRQTARVATDSDGGKKDSKVHTSCPAASNSSKVAVGIPTFVSTSGDNAASVAGRVCNGMPPVVTRMLRMSNASTSVNTLPQKLHGKVGEQQQQQQPPPQASPPQAARSLARNPIQPATQTAGQATPLAVTTHSLVRTSPSSAISLAVAKRQASELQALQQQQQQQHHLQQQLLEQQQRIQLIQQHPFLSIHAAAAARWNAADVLARVPAMTPQAASPTSAHANGLGVTMATAQSGSDGREAGGRAAASKKQEAGPTPAKQQKQGAYKKLAEATPSKKKISDIANTLHKKVSQSCGGSHKAADASPAADAKRPPNAHTASKAKAPETAGQQAHAHGKASFPASSHGDREDEPLNLVTRDKDSQRHSRGASPRMQTSSSV